MVSKKERVDVLLVQKGYFETREKAKRAIMAGLVFSQAGRIDKPGLKIPVDTELMVKGNKEPYVSRGGLKLEKAIRSFGIEMERKIVLDIGASTGGFTDCALKHGARLVYALDVGYGQLDWSLRTDDRVVVMERTNFRYSKVEDFRNGRPEMATIDVSFISLRLIFPVLYDILVPDGEVVALIKPQFEAGRDKVGRKGVIKDPAVHREVLHQVLSHALTQGFQCKKIGYSPITGGDGNIEFLAYFRKVPRQEVPAAPRVEDWSDPINQVVTEAHLQLSQKYNWKN